MQSQALEDRQMCFISIKIFDRHTSPTKFVFVGAFNLSLFPHLVLLVYLGDTQPIEILV